MDEAASVGLATSLKYSLEGWLDVLYDARGKPIGMWLKSAGWGKHEHAIMKAMCSMLKMRMERGDRKDALPDDQCLLIYAGAYRIVKNILDARGGVFVLVGDAVLPESAPPLVAATEPGLWRRLFGGRS